ncbi:MAG: hydrolase alpha/beta domain protein [Candidatus Levybacteria bacterium GW2011_GWC1_40_19]|nr:MAG: hydrolase alpha/beta domain protein [Candidatus Levybacteria bacterium GW2011_GWC1_40_19]KKR73269.1 MAG: hydrolase alpha/beta domain protein [Candidatus Levybacteria bacterium GW2011_GWC2_40_7]OGH49696.1 MAG: hypothetical protein A3J18_02770 [Candidatus Levybacteria bacterium RIFCSPLOWO2_02_FULL_40_18]OGH55035.1 MAG: hypothetical protein A2596_03200 [Candidatus Levybacteria bacterium RIFOXYD1_FULL_40_21]OGH70525.1 MAG: hypothetical protein A2396_01145 [Candidatus Levybacteria bacterium 
MYLDIDGGSVYYQETGSGRPLILLHGWGQDVSSFWGLVPLLKNKFRLYLIDLPGFGRSELPKKSFTVQDYADVIKKFIKQKKLEKPIVLGHSLGGRVAIKLASSNPNLIDKLILEGAAGIKPKQGLLKIGAYIPAKIFRFLIPNIFNLKTKIRHKFYKVIGSDYINAGPLRETLKNILAEDLTQDLKKINNETLLIWGDRDPNPQSSISIGKKMYRLIKNSRIEVIEEAGHFPHLENPKMFAYYVKEFV